MGASYTFLPGDPIVAAAQRGDLVDMYTRLNAAPMYDILKMLETLDYNGLIHFLGPRQTIDPSAQAAHLNAISQAPIFQERMQVALVAVILAGRVTSFAFQKQYDAYLNMIPNDQRQNIFEFLASRAPQKSEQIGNLLSLGGFVYPTAWKIATSSGGNASYSYFTGASGFLYLQHSDSPDEIYRYPYAGAGLGKSVSKWSAGYSTKDFPSGGIGRLYRSGSRAADLTSSSFAGVGVLVSVSASLVDKGWSIGGIGAAAGLTLVMLSMLGTMGEYDDVNKVPERAGAVGLLYGLSGEANSNKVDAGISWVTILVGPPVSVKL